MSRFFLLLAILGILCLEFGCAARNQDFEAGVALRNAGRFEESAAAFGRAIEKDPEQGLFHFNRAVVLAKAGHLVEAVDDYNQALTLGLRDEHKVMAYYQRGMTLAALKNFETAVADYTRAIELDPEDMRFPFNRAEALAKLGRHEEAILDLDLVIQGKPKYYFAYLRRAESLAKLRRYQEAVRDYSSTVALKKNYPAAYYNRAFALRFMGLFDEAARDFTTVIRQAPDKTTARIGLAEALILTGRFEDARSTVDESLVLELKHGEKVALARLGCIALAAAGLDHQDMENKLLKLLAKGSPERPWPNDALTTWLGDSGLSEERKAEVVRLMAING